MQRERWEREKEQARRQFQDRIIVREEEVRQRPEQKEEKLDMIFNNEDHTG